MKIVTLLTSCTCIPGLAQTGTVAIACTVTASVIDVTAGRSIVESGTVPATRSGSTATCIVSMPYSWTLSAPTTDSLSLNYT
jgi:hypothetical protein